MADDSAEKKWQKTQLGYVLPGFSRFQEAYRNSTRRAPLSGGFRRSTPGRHASNRSTGKSFYHVKTPRRMLVYVAAIFFILPISIFILKELHMHTTEEHQNEQVLQKQHQAAHKGKDAFVTWMEDAEKEASHEHIFEPIAPEHDNSNASLTHRIGDFLGLNHDDEDLHKSHLRPIVHNHTAQNHLPEPKLDSMSGQEQKREEHIHSALGEPEHDANSGSPEDRVNLDQSQDLSSNAVVPNDEFDNSFNTPKEENQEESSEGNQGDKSVADLSQDPDTDGNSEGHEEVETNGDESHKEIGNDEAAALGPENEESGNENDTMDEPEDALGEAEKDDVSNEESDMDNPEMEVDSKMNQKGREDEGAESDTELESQRLLRGTYR